MKDIIIGLSGALIGAVASIVATLMSLKQQGKRQTFLIIDNIICILYNLKWTKETVEYGRRLALLFQEGCYPS